jgi:putative Ca2+/H+ antiporter (TMEM165/GDT1 family)
MKATAYHAAQEVSEMPRIAGLWMGIIAVVVGILIIAFPDLIRWILGLAFIVMGLMAVFPAMKR